MSRKLIQAFLIVCLLAALVVGISLLLQPESLHGEGGGLHWRNLVFYFSLGLAGVSAVLQGVGTVAGWLKGPPKAPAALPVTPPVATQPRPAHTPRPQPRPSVCPAPARRRLHRPHR